jgi:myo-inositol-1-phosphate synthase
VLADADTFEKGLDTDSDVITPGMLYAYAAIVEGCPYVNFTPSLAADVPALKELAQRLGVPTAGKDGKTGQTLIKTVLAPAFRTRGLRVEGWYSTNILGNRDGQILDDPSSLASKLGTKGSVLDDILGYEVDDHVVRIDYYRPRGDAKEAWDNIDLVGFLGQRCSSRSTSCAATRSSPRRSCWSWCAWSSRRTAAARAGPQDQLGCFFKAPVTADGDRPEHALHVQERAAAGLADA